MTPTPWLREGRTVYVLQHNGWRRGEELFCNRWSAHVQGGPGATDGELDRVAAMIAATPDLMEALQRLDAVLDFGEPGSDDKPMIFEDWSELNAAFDDARAALAKAKAQGPQL